MSWSFKKSAKEDVLRKCFKVVFFCFFKISRGWMFFFLFGQDTAAEEEFAERAGA